MAEGITYKCPTCGAGMVFDAESGKLKCDYCGQEMSIEELASKTKQEVKFDSEADKQQEEIQFLQYHCSSCGAEILTDKDTTATMCSFCGSPTLIEDRLIGATRPKQVIPFKITRDKMEEAFHNWTKNGLLTPDDFTSQNTIDKITGLYAPYWLFDYHAEAHLEAHCTTVRMQRKGDTQYTYTKHFEVARDIEVDYDKIPLDASERLDDNMMDKLEPFVYDDLKPFAMEYLSGFQSEKYNYTSDDLNSRIKQRVKKYTDEESSRSIEGYDTVHIVQNHLNMKEKKADYTLLPVWLLNYRYKGKNYTFALNGQTGKIVGDLPISKGKVAKWYGIVFGITTVLAALIGGLL
jgi:DNA-directed RNA polymerase subunit RPC12/RpoP